MSRAIVSIQNVSKLFGSKVVAVDDVSLDIEEGEFFALLGPSGCGKTTLLRMLAGFEIPTSGRVMIDGEDMEGVDPNRRPVNMVFQSYAVFPHMNVASNVGYGLKVTGVPRSEIDAQVEEALALVKLDGYEQRMPSQLSGGQRQRVALARALIKRPKVLLLDEPLSALDAKLREAMQLELVRLRNAVGITFIIVTHDQNEALSMANRVAVMNGGRVAQVATPGRALRVSEQPLRRRLHRQDQPARGHRRRHGKRATAG
jgi:spermidine/putrescine transport system ATP-binding protein